MMPQVGLSHLKSCNATFGCMKPSRLPDDDRQIVQGVEAGTLKCSNTVLYYRAAEMPAIGGQEKGQLVLAEA